MTFRISKNLFLIAISFFLTNLALAQEGPFGLNWGDTAQQIKSKGSLLVESKRDGSFVFYKTNKLPKHVSIAETYSLIIHDKYGLQKAALFSKNITNDIYGTKGKETYSQFKEALVEKYGSAKNSYEYTGRKLYEDSDEFYQCLRYQGCGTYFTYWDLGDKGAISTELKGVSRGVGFFSLNYEGPNWSKAVDEEKSKETSKDKSAL